MIPNFIKHQQARNVLELDDLIADDEWRADLERDLDGSKEKAPAGETQSAQGGADAF